MQDQNKIGIQKSKNLGFTILFLGCWLLYMGVGASVHEYFCHIRLQSYIGAE